MENRQGAVKNPKRDTRFKPGKSGNPGGRPKLPADREIRNLTSRELTAMATLIVTSDVATLREIIKSPNSTTLQVMVASIAAKIISKGDAFAFDKLMDRILGKVKDNVQITNINEPPQVVVTLPSNGYEIKKLDEKNE